MRRRGLRDRIRHQRRLTRRLIARHVMALRARPAVRMLGALDAWLGEDEPLTPTRFVPPLIESAETEPATTPSVSDEIDEFDALTSEPSDENIDLDAVDLPSAPTAPWPVPELVQPPRPSAPEPRAETPPAPARPNERPAPRAVATPPNQPGQPAAHRTSAPRDSVQPPPTPPAGPRPTARERQVPIVPRREGISTPRTGPASVAPAEPTPPPAVTRESGATAARTPVSPDTGADTDQPIASADQARSDASLANADVVSESDVAPNVAGSSGTPATPAHEGNAPVSATPRVDSRSTDTPTPAASPERTSHADTVQRALAALRATGELAPSKRPSAAPSQRPPASPPSVPAAPDRMNPTVPRATTPARAPSGQRATPAARDTTAAPVAPRPLAPETSSTDQEVADAESLTRAGTQGSADTPVAPLRDEAVTDGGRPPVPSSSARSADSLSEPTPSPDTPATRPNASPPEPAVANGEAAQTPPSVAPSAAAQSIEPPAGPPTATPVNERRQARRPAHLDRPRPEAPAASNASPSVPQRPSEPPLTRAPDRKNDGQFKFGESERTLKDWQRLLFEATNPPQPGARRQSPKAETRAPTSPAVTPGATARQPSQPRPSAPPAPGARPEPGPSTPPPTRAQAAPEAPNAGTGAPSTPELPQAESVNNEASPETDTPTTPAAVAQAMRALPAQPVAPSTRRFLRPLVGVDPDSVRIHRGDAAARLAESQGADAIAAGDDIALAAGHDERDPDTIALIAHEITHAARARDRRFVPPAARSTRTGSTENVPPTRGAVRTPSRGSASAGDEEAVAEVVETRVRAAATRERQKDTSVQPNDPFDDVVDLTDDETIDSEQIESPRVAALRPSQRGSSAPNKPDARRSQWGALPAPWEPLPPALLGHAQDTQSLSNAPPTTSSSTPPSGTAESTPVVYHAEQSSGSAGEAPAHAEAPPQAAAGPDIDALARQVYNVLKRRLAAEARRGA